MTKTGNPETALCTKTHEYLIPDNDQMKIGITDHAVEQLGDIVFVELPEVGAKFAKGDVFGTIESVKAASELYMPIDGTVSEINDKLTTEPELINDDCFGKGWLIKISNYDKNELDLMMPYKEYKEYIEEEEH